RPPLRLVGRPALARRGRRDVSPAGAGPDHAHPDARARKAGDAAVSRRRVLVELASLTLGALLLVWSLTPVYNMLLIALDPDEGDIEFEGIICPPAPSLPRFHTLLTPRPS